MGTGNFKNPKQGTRFSKTGKMAGPFFLLQTLSTRRERYRVFRSYIVGHDRWGMSAALLELSRRRFNDRLRGHDETIGKRLLRDRGALLPLPPAPNDACEKKAARVNSLSLV